MKFKYFKNIFQVLEKLLKFWFFEIVKDLNFKFAAVTSASHVRFWFYAWFIHFLKKTQTMLHAEIQKAVFMRL